MLSNDAASTDGCSSKRAADDLEQRGFSVNWQDHVALTDKVAIIVPVMRPIIRPTSPTKSATSRSNSPTKANKREVLQRFTKPVESRRLGTIDDLPTDIQGLYDRLSRSRSRQGIIPGEIQEQVTRHEGPHEAWPYLFRPAKTSSDAIKHAAQAQTQLESLLDIVEEADIAERQSYHESDWNAIVHTLVLRTVFPTRPPVPLPRGAELTETDLARARLVCATSAGILPEYMPTIRRSNRMNTADFDEELGTTTGSTATEGLRARSSGRKKVDLLLSLEAVKGSSLHKVLNGVCDGQVTKQTPTPFVNHTDHIPVQYAPIAVCVETKVSTAAQDCSLQLGTWIAAWQNRMLAHRSYLRTEFPELMSNEPSVRIPSTLLIEVVGHRWTLWFACDADTEISLFGPLDIGSTQRLTELYLLIAVLKDIKVWMEGDFRKAIQRWFISDKLDGVLR